MTAFSATQMASAGDLTGVINFKGAAPAERELAPIKEFKGISGKSTGTSAAPAVLDQKGALYTPQIVPSRPARN